MRYTLTDGGVIDAGAKLGEGGEGVVFEALDGQRAIKIYHKPLVGSAANKLRAMLALDAGGLATQAAWPQALIAGAGGAIAGFVMSKAPEPFDIHTVYSPRDRREKLPRADWRFLVQVATNLAAAFHTAHAVGVVIGDVNHGSVRVGKDGRVRLIDCDSCQITSGGATMRCGVGVDAYTPPELQGVTLASVDRTPDSDAFGLAVLIFQLLFMGRHPYAGAPRTSQAPTDIPAAIAARAYAYAARAALLKPPPSAPPIDLVAPELAALFEVAFASSGKRPTPADWHQALVVFAKTLSVCAANPRHQTPAHLKSCPWCAFEKAGVDFFPAPMTVGAVTDAGRFDQAAFEAAWNRIETAEARIRALLAAADPHAGGADGLPVSVSHDLRKACRPGPRPALGPRLTGWLRRAVGTASVGFALWTLAFVSAEMAGVSLVLGAGAHLLTSRLPGASRDSLCTAREELRRLSIARFHELGSVLETAGASDTGKARRQKGAQLMRTIRALQKQLHDAPREAQLKSFLEKFPLQKDSVTGIGQSRITQLASFGIESAADIERAVILEIPGFGPQLADRLCRWRDDLKSRFRFNPSQPARSADIRRLERDLKAPLEAFRQELAKASRQAQAIELRMSAVMQRSAVHDAAISAAVTVAAAAEADHHAARLIPWRRW